MSEEDIQTFCDITVRDRRTAIYCLQRHNNNLGLAISYFFDNSHRISIPADFMADGTAPPPPPPPPPTPAQRPPSTGAGSSSSSIRQELLRQGIIQTPSPARRASRGSTSQAANPPPANPVGPPSARIMRNMNKYQKEKPSLFLPFGMPSEKPTPFDDKAFQIRKDDPPLPEKLFPCIHCDYMKCIVWINGISIKKDFYPKSHPKYKEALKQIKKNMLPTALFDSVQKRFENIDLDIEFMAKEYDPQSIVMLE